MKTLLPIALLLLCSSCARQMMQVFDTSAIKAKLVDSNWVFENDTVKITYSFWANHGVVAFSIFNKLNKPIYVNWESCSLIYNSIKLNYWSDEVKVATISSGYYYNGPLIKAGYTTSSENSGSVVYKPEKITFIPPKSYIYCSKFILYPSLYKMSYKTGDTVLVPQPNRTKKVSIVYRETFDKTNSPLSFRNYLAFSFTEDAQNLFFSDNEFYVGAVKEMEHEAYLGKPIGNDGDKFIYGKSPFQNNTSFFISFKGSSHQTSK